MDYVNACKILEICEKHLDEDVKKAYFRMALRYHPDKYKQDKGEKFKEVKEAYEFLTKQPRYFDKNHININKNIDYKELIKMCVKYFSPDSKWDNLFIDTSFQGIIKDCHHVSLKIFEKLSKDKAEKVYEFITKYNYILELDDDLINELKNKLQKKMIYDNIIILNPNLKDLFNDNIYKLNVKDKEFYIPLWHHELHFSLQDKDLIVKCEPELPKNIWINRYNNIFITKQIKLNILFEKGFYEFEVGEKLIKIDSKSLKITKEKQIVILKEDGILKINEEHTFDSNTRGDIYIEIYLI
tara:strand:- start:1493 stop:2386 length:894 start_codon:yes stop_codon:yes gene_type:complete